MRVLTVRQPWAACILHAGKDVENRVRSLGPYTGPVAIASSQKYDSMADVPAFAWPAGLTGISCWTGSLLGVVDLVGTHHDGEAACAEDGVCSRWAEPSCYHLMLSNPRALTIPIPYSGGLGLRHLEPHIAEQVLEALKESA